MAVVMENKSRKIITPSNVPYIGIGFALLYWMADSSIDVYLFNTNLSLFKSFFLPDATQLWLRCFVLLLFMLFSVYIKFILEKHERLVNKMDETEKRLEYMLQDLNMEIHERKEAILELQELAITDPLTGIFNRRKLQEVLHYEISRKYRYDSDLSIVMCDIDYFKKINDEHGHHAGDNVLKLITKVINENIRESDVFARWGGEEFVVLMPNTGIISARMVANKLQKVVANTQFPGVGTVTASFGVALFSSNSDKADSFVNRSDKALYKAKRCGRNEVQIAV